MRQQFISNSVETRPRIPQTPTGCSRRSVPRTRFGTAFAANTSARESPKVNRPATPQLRSSSAHGFGSDLASSVDVALGDECELVATVGLEPAVARDQSATGMVQDD